MVGLDQSSADNNSGFRATAYTCPQNRGFRNPHASWLSPDFNDYVTNFWLPRVIMIGPISCLVPKVFWLTKGAQLITRGCKKAEPTPSFPKKTRTRLLHTMGVLRMRRNISKGYEKYATHPAVRLVRQPDLLAHPAILLVLEQLHTEADGLSNSRQTSRLRTSEDLQRYCQERRRL